MIRYPSVGRLLVFVSVAAGVFGTGGTARAQEECPLGSTQKSESGATWCEPTVCDQDTQCPTGSVCRPVALCVEIGTLDQAGAKTDGGQRLLVRQRCGADKSCPQKTTCSDKGRCITRAQAEKAGLTAVAAAGDAGGTGAATDAPKKACGCHVPGTSGGERGGAALALLGLVAIGARRRSRARSVDPA
jgi:MYXO-CTERM domain-containing protein